MAQLFAAYVPIVLLVFLMTRRNSLPSYKALPFCALVAYLCSVFVFKIPLKQVHAAVIDGLLLAWTPTLIIAGAIFLFRALEATGGLEVIRAWLNSISVNPVAQLVIVAWAFSFLIEGASGFGTPAAIAGPILVGLGFAPVRVAIVCLILNSVPVTFGAVGTPLWFGLSPLSLGQDQMQLVAWKAALINSLCAPVVVFLALSFLVSWRQLLKNSGFILLSVAACVLPFLLVSRVSTEFPSLVGGFLGLLLSVLFAKLGWGLSKSETAIALQRGPSLLELVKASFPIWATVLILVITRIPQLGIKSILQLSDPSLTFGLGMLGELSISASIVLRLDTILGTQESWSHSLLYVPSLLPFGLVAVLALWLNKRPLGPVVGATVQQMKLAFVALLGALVFVNLMMLGQERSAVSVIGNHLASFSGQHWLFMASLLGALGSFFSGSATISNLTFGGVQASIAEQLGLELTTLLALQTVGAAMGNMVCINNIVAVASVLSLGNKEGFILKRTSLVMLCYATTVALLVGLI